MDITAAILYHKDGYDTGGKRLLGRHSAGEGFLKSLVQHGTADSLYCCTDSEATFKEFCSRIQPWLQQPRKVRWISTDRLDLLSQPGTIYRPDPALADMVWGRRFVNQRAYSVCGVTHTIATKYVMESIGNLITAPVQPWDALICTSNAVKNTVEGVLREWSEYLAQRNGGQPEILVKLPVIPLGVDCSAFPQGVEAVQAGDRQRQELGISPGDIVVLFVGRLTFSAKAHPVPMYIALERAAQQTKAKIHLIQAGWIEDPREEPDFKNSAKIFCPSVNAIFVDGRKPEIRVNIWSASDIFISLSDNIQETFGLTPIEAMANGLPAIVSDWNGYKESVRHEIDGFRIPTLIPPPEACLDLALNYLDGSLNWPTYMGHTSLATAVDIDACTRALCKLIENPELRKRMGESARQRARDIYDWKVVIAAYEQLWRELAEIRVSAPESAPAKAGKPPYPLGDDPFRVLGHYATRTLTDDMILSLGAIATPELLRELHRIWFTSFGQDRRISVKVQIEMLNAIEQKGSLNVGEVLRRYATNEQESAYLYRTLLYLVKFGVLVTGNG
ncbi:MULTISPECIES: glycosyltransferase family 4 protein [unclassified Microcoleus]|uniref:glycosyltransferase family 4 protein n=1 Tax=unclassified Microcoleus TaxID=2642155 RepID=UPI001D5CB88B|nr:MULTISPECIES: glycosyltransferase family 4 protein [unclassified Microcoleus]MCC3566795.1 glycosyltransferase family 4 protein [Microcoleus sp. PH2017_31_RDM_U_A]MCC3579067.1 glycosyltransferase family 4 protein [Microcoleus sp. PH2017_32_RDM_D_A]MCC3617191.1 glycosyltransferase family 4 protein [Microcoleus sp. PH2017_38_RDM_U_B]